MEGKKCESWYISRASKYGLALICGEGNEFNTNSKELILISKELCYYIDILTSSIGQNIYDNLLFEPITYFYNSIKLVPIDPTITGEERAIYEEQIPEAVVDIAWEVMQKLEAGKL
jgi:hypothetical protein